LKAVKSFASGTAGALAISFPVPGLDTWKLRQFRQNNAHAKILALMLSFYEPRDLLTGAKIDTTSALSWANNKEYHHFFPRDYLKTSKSKLGPNSLANIVMLTSISNKAISNRAPSDYLKDVIDRLGGDAERAFESNLISKTALDAALRDDYEAFLEARAQTLNSVAETLAQWKV
jgi:hypothetical protein